VKEMATGISALAAARATPTASSVLVMVIAVTMTTLIGAITVRRCPPTFSSPTVLCRQYRLFSHHLHLSKSAGV